MTPSFVGGTFSSSVYPKATTEHSDAGERGTRGPVQLHEVLEVARFLLSMPEPSATNGDIEDERHEHLRTGAEEGDLRIPHQVWGRAPWAWRSSSTPPGPTHDGEHKRCIRILTRCRPNQHRVQQWCPDTQGCRSW